MFKYFRIYKNGKLETVIRTLVKARKYCKTEANKHRRSLYEIWCVVEKKSGSSDFKPEGHVYYNGETILYLNLEKKQNYEINNNGTLGKKY